MKQTYRLDEMIIGLLFMGCVSSVEMKDPLQGAIENVPVQDAIYFVLVDRFSNKNTANDGQVDTTDAQAWHGGDLEGVLDRLDWIQEMGVHTVWLSPVFSSHQEKFYEWGAFHGYWVQNMTEIEGRFGDLGDLKAVAEGLHDREMHLMVDMVYNHTGFESPLLKAHPDWFHPPGEIEDWTDPHQLVFHQVGGLPDLAQENEAVYAYLLTNSLRMAEEVKPDSFRVDAVRHMAPEFLKRLRDDMSQAQGHTPYFAGEVFDGDPIELSKAWKASSMDGVFDFPLHYGMVDVFCKDVSPAKLGAILSLDRVYENSKELITFLDNHDVSRITSACGGNEERVQEAMSFQTRMRGHPAFTYGIESGLEGAKEPENRQDMVFLPDHPNRVLLTKLLKERAQHPALHSGASQMWFASEESIAVLRVSSCEAALVVVHRGEEPFDVPIPLEMRESQLHAVGGTLIQEALPQWVVGHGTHVLFAVPDGQCWPEWVVDIEAPSDPRRVVLRPLGEPQEGEQWVFTGAGPELGHWDPKKGIPWVDGKFVVNMPSRTVLEGKWVRVGEGDVTRWEEGSNRWIWVGDRKGDVLVPLGSWGEG